MNKKFYNLSLEKQNKIINAGFEAFSKTEYKKTSMLYISQKAGISKPLLFHYFNNKKEFYLFLCDFGVNCIKERMEKVNISSISDFFKLYSVSSHEKCMMFKEYKYIQMFLLQVYLNEEASVETEWKTFKSNINTQTNKYILDIIDKYKFKNESDIPMIIEIVNWASEGLMRDNLDLLEENLGELELKYLALLDMLKKNFYKEEYLNE